jgi:hypothetical protein
VSRAARIVLASTVVVIAAAWSVRRLQPPAFQAGPRGTLVLSPVTIINPGRDRSTKQTLVVREGRIESISSQPLAGPPSRLTRILAGRYVVPGLIDVHAHLPPDVVGLPEYFAVMYLRVGVTSVCFAGDRDGTVGRMQRLVNAGEWAAPRIVRCGALLGGEGSDESLTRYVQDPSAATEAVRGLVAAGAQCVAVGGGVGEAIALPVREAAHAAGVPVLRQLAPGSDVGAMEANLGVPSVPTLAAWTAMSAAAPPAVPDNPLVPHLFENFLWRAPEGLEILYGIWGASDGWTLRRVGATVPAAPDAAAIAELHALVGRLHHAGGVVLAGSDAPNPGVLPGYGLLLELHHLAYSGVDVEEAWAAATWRAALALGLQPLGELTPGAPADLLVFRDDPTVDLAALATLEAVMVDGRYYSAHGRLKASMDYLRYAHGRLFDWWSLAAVQAEAWRARHTAP